MSPRKVKTMSSIEKVGNYVILDGYFRVSKGLYNTLDRSIDKRVNTMLLGETGSGKTELVHYLAKTKGMPLTIFDMSTMSDPIMSLIGTHTIQIVDGKQQSVFVPSRFSKAIQEPGIILLDEISRASHGAANLLFPCLDFRRELPMEYCFHDCSPIKVHPDCVFFATANLGAEYTGTTKIDRALLDRFLTLETDLLEQGQVEKLIERSYPSLSADSRAKIIAAYFGLDKMHSDCTIGFKLSFRHLKQICEMVSDNFTIYDSFYNICKGLASKQGVSDSASVLNALKNE